MSLLISTVADGSRNRLAPLAELPCTMPGHVAAMLGAHHQHVAAVALGDDLLLQILRRVLAAHELIERRAQPLPLLPEPSRIAPQRGAGVVEHLARRIDRMPDGGDLACLKLATRATTRARIGKTPVACRTARPRLFHRIEEVGDDCAAAAGRAAALPRRARERLVQPGRRRAAETAHCARDRPSSRSWR